MSFILGIVIGYVGGSLLGIVINPLLKQAYDAIVAKIKGTPKS